MQITANSPQAYRFRTTFLSAIFVLAGLFSTLAQALDTLPVEVARLPVIRIGIGLAPGNGHQSAGVMVYTRLRQLGFQGKVEVIYVSDKRGESSNKVKMGFLLPPFDPSGTDDQYFPDINLRVTSAAFMRAHPMEFPEIPLAIMGADDYGLNPRAFKTRVLLRLQPFGWEMGGALDWYSESQDVEVSRLITHTSRNLTSLPYIFELPKPYNLGAFLNSQMSHIPELAKKISGLRAILENLNRLELAPAYGHYIGSQVINYSAGILSAIQKHPALFPKGVVIPVINTLHDTDVQYLRKIINVSASAEGKIEVIDILDSSLVERCKNLPAGKILIVNLGPVPKPVFELLFDKSTIPPVVEGVNTINLMQLIGRPYLPSIAHEGYPFDGVNALAVDAWQAMLEYGTVENYLPISHSTRSLSEFIYQARLPGSALNAQFSSFKTNMGQERDKVYQGLLATAAVLRSNFRADTVLPPGFIDAGEHPTSWIRGRFNPAPCINALHSHLWEAQ